LIQFDRDNVRFFPLENSANKLLDSFGVGDDADFAGRHRALVDRRPILKEGYCGAALRGALAIARLEEGCPSLGLTIRPWLRR